jgi:hypothetical protein
MHRGFRLSSDSFNARIQLCRLVHNMLYSRTYQTRERGCYRSSGVGTYEIGSNVHSTLGTDGVGTACA